MAGDAQVGAAAAGASARAPVDETTMVPIPDGAGKPRRSCGAHERRVDAGRSRRAVRGMRGGGRSECRCTPARLRAGRRRAHDVRGRGGEGTSDAQARPAASLRQCRICVAPTGGPGTRCASVHADSFPADWLRAHRPLDSFPLRTEPSRVVASMKRFSPTNAAARACPCALQYEPRPLHRAAAHDWPETDAFLQHFHRLRCRTTAYAQRRCLRRNGLRRLARALR